MWKVYLHNDVVDWDVYQFNKESNKAHDSKSDGSGYSNLLEFYKRQNIIQRLGRQVYVERVNTSF